MGATTIAKFHKARRWAKKEGRRGGVVGVIDDEGGTSIEDRCGGCSQGDSDSHEITTGQQRKERAMKGAKSRPKRQDLTGDGLVIKGGLFHSVYRILAAWKVWIHCITYYVRPSEWCRLSHLQPWRLRCPIGRREWTKAHGGAGFDLRQRERGWKQGGKWEVGARPEDKG
ncbi:hypothetical protein GE21DRAFT_1012456 [Neurospora crassa]|nr:hypothetical protein GE21DRAFT_1012456 [Neurospora crassa]